MTHQRALAGALTIVSVIAAVMLAGCGSSSSSTEANGSGGSSSSSTEANGSGEKKPSIAAVSIAGSEEYELYAKGMEQEAEKLGLDLKVYNSPSLETAAISSTISSAVATNPEYLIAAAIEASALRQPLLNASERGIKVITYDSQVEDPNFVLSFVNSDYHEIGELSAKALGDAIEGNGSMAQMLTAIPGNQDLESMIEGFEEALRPGLTPLPTQYSQGENGKANEIVRALLTREPNLGGIVAVSGFGGEGTVSALSEAGEIGKVKVVLQIGSPFAIKALRSGEVQAVIGDQPVTIGEEAVKVAYEDANGRPVKPKVVVPVCTLTIENIDHPEYPNCVH